MKKFIVTILSLVILFSTSTTSFASEVTKNQTDEIEMSFDNQKISLSLPKNVVAEFTDYNVVMLTDISNGLTETLPTSTVDMNGKYVSLSYVKTANGIDVYASYQTRGIWNGVKCVAGVVGSAGLGGLGGASVGTITIPIVGSVSGTLVGAISGGLTGVASFC